MQQVPNEPSGPTQQPAEQDMASGPRSVGVEQPGKLLRIAMMVREMLEEVRRAPLDTDAREHLADIHRKVIGEMRDGLSQSLSDELDRLALPFGPEDVPSEAELRIAQAQLLGWLEGLFQGIQAAIATQQMSMAAQLEEMRRRMLPSPEGVPQPPQEQTPGQYL